MPSEVAEILGLIERLKIKAIGGKIIPQITYNSFKIYALAITIILMTVALFFLKFFNINNIKHIFYN